MDGILPFASLKHAKELALHCKTRSSSRVKWPGNWDWLKDLTKLSFHFQSSLPPDRSWGGNYILQNFFMAVLGLRDLEVTSRFDRFNDDGQEYILLLADRLVKLTRLQVNLESVGRGVIAPRSARPALPGALAGEGMTAYQRAWQICGEVGQCVPWMNFAVSKVDCSLKCGGYVELHLMMTLNRSE